MTHHHRAPALRFGMHVYDTHTQLLGTVTVVHRQGFILRQRLGTDQLIDVPCALIGAVVGGVVLLCVTPGELQLLGRVLETRGYTDALVRAIGPRRSASVA